MPNLLCFGNKRLYDTARRHICCLLGLLLTFVCTDGQAKQGGEDYDSLAQLSSQKLMDSGRTYFSQKQGGKALACFMIVSERHKKQHDDSEVQMSIRALNNCACVYKYIFYDYTQAYEYFVRAYDLCKTVGYDEFLPVIMVNLGDLLNDYGTSYNSQSLSQQAKDIFDQCIEQAHKTGNWELMTTAFFNLSNQNYTLPLEKYRCLFDKAIPDSTRDLQYARLQYQGLQHVQQGRYAEARYCFLQQLSVVMARWEPERDTLATYMNIAHTYRMEGDRQQETAYLERAMEMANAYEVSDLATSLCNLLAESYREQGNQAMQQHFRLMYLEKKEEAHANKLANIGELNYIHQLKLEQERADELAERQSLQQILLAAAGLILLVVLVSIALLWQKNRKLHARNKSLYEKNEQLLQVEREEQQLRRDIEQLTAAKYSRSSLSDEQREALIFRIREIMDNPDIVCQQEFTLNKLAKLVDSNTTYVSQVVNEKYGIAFSNVLANIRVREACRRISGENDQYSQITIEAIAASVGFKSRTAFINAFKREVGLTPSEYLRMAQAN